MTSHKALTAEQVIQHLNLEPLAKEGGFFRRTYESSASVVVGDGSSSKRRHVCTAIFYLVTPNDFSAIHRVESDEMFHFYSGDPVEMIQFADTGKCVEYTMSDQIENGHHPQLLVPGGTWQGLRLKSGGEWALLGTTVAPGFEYEDFQIGDRNKLKVAFPDLENIIDKFTYPEGK